MLQKKREKEKYKIRTVQESEETALWNLRYKQMNDEKISISNKMQFHSKRPWKGKASKIQKICGEHLCIQLSCNNSLFHTTRNKRQLDYKAQVHHATSSIAAPLLACCWGAKNGTQGLTVLGKQSSPSSFWNGLIGRVHTGLQQISRWSSKSPPNSLLQPSQLSSQWSYIWRLQVSRPLKKSLFA